MQRVVNELKSQKTLAHRVASSSQLASIASFAALIDPQLARTTVSARDRFAKSNGYVLSKLIVVSSALNMPACTVLQMEMHFTNDSRCPSWSTSTSACARKSMSD